MHDTRRASRAAPAEAPSAYLLDLDGTLYAAGAAIPGAVETLDRLRQAGTPFRLVTNTTSRSRASIVERLTGYGFTVGSEEVFTATLAGVELLREAGHQRVAPFVPAGALEDMSDLELVGGTSGLAGEGPVDAVVLGDLGERWTYRLMQEAFERVTAGATLLALSRDRYWHQGNRLALDAGPFVAALEYATGTTAVIAGKPSPAFFAAAVRSLGAGKGERIAMVGDDLWSDVEGAQRAGLEGWLVRTGKFRDEALRQSSITPNRIVTSVAELAMYL
ncbi:MAG: TIGR01458 family HAD-type hydrolase [Gemmatimonadales bacterium]